MYDTLIIGSGLSSIFFLEGYKNRNEKLGIISYDTNENKNDESTNILLKKKIIDNLPPRFESGNIGAISNFFIKNKINQSSNLSIFGLLQEGGVSNYWGMSCEFPKNKKLDFLNKKNRESLVDSFNYIYNKFNFEGEIFNESILSTRDKKIENYFSKFLQANDVNINFYKNCSAINSAKCLKTNNQCWNNCPTKATVLPSMISGNKKNFDKLNYFVNAIIKDCNVYKIHCTSQSNEKKVFITKKLILACGTIGTTRLLLEMLNYESSVRVFHNPMLFACMLSNQKVQKDLKHWLSQIASNSFDEETNSFAVSNFRTTNEYIKKRIFNDYWFMKNTFSQQSYEYFAERMVFANLYIEGKYSNLAMKKMNQDYKIFSPNKDFKLTNKILKNHLKKNLKTLSKHNLITSFSYSSIPKAGHDNHYTGTVKINGIDTPLSVNEMCELKNFDNIFIIDGSVIPGDISFFPTGIIMANAHRVGSAI